MSNHQSLSLEQLKHEPNRRNEAAYRYMAQEGIRGRHDAHRNGPTLVSETFMRQRALLEEATLRHLTHEARRAGRNALAERGKRRQPRFVPWLPPARWWGRF